MTIYQILMTKYQRPFTNEYQISTKEYVRIYKLFMQNKANFVRFSPENPVFTKKQSQFNPIQTQLKPKQSQFKANLSSVSCILYSISNIDFSSIKAIICKSRNLMKNNFQKVKTVENGSKKSKLKSLFQTSRPNFLAASAAPVLVGSTLAYAITGSFNFGLFILAMLAIMLLHTGANMANDYFDHLSGNDWANKNVTPFSGGSRSIQDGILYFQAAAALSRTASFHPEQNYSPPWLPWPRVRQ